MIQPLGSDAVRELLRKRIDQQKQAVGIVAGLIDADGRRVVAHGHLAGGDARMVDGDTIFEIGSITKVFTSLLLADMVERREVALDDAAAMYLPAGVTLPQRNGRSIALIDLATHTSGLPAIPGNLKPKDPRNPYAGYGIDDVYEFLAGYVLPRDPGAVYEYSNLGAGVLGHVLACRAGTDYETVIRTRITQPLGMADTAITLSPSMQARMATGHNALFAPVPHWGLGALAGAGALRSSANDMLTFLDACLGNIESPLAPAMTAMRTVRRPLGVTPMKSALGWAMLGESAWHNGGTGGFRSFAGYDPLARTAVVVLSNTMTLAGVDDIGGHIWNPKVPLASPDPPPRRRSIAIDPARLDHYAGRYQSPDRVLEISRHGDSLFVQVSAAAGAGPTFEILAESETQFFVKETGSQLRFEFGPDGRATSVTMQRAGREPMRAERMP